MSGLVAVESLLQFGVHHSLIEEFDVVQVRNQLYDLLKYAPQEVNETFFTWHNKQIPETATRILTDLTDNFVAKGHMQENTTVSRDLLESAIMGILMPRQSEMIARFHINYANSPQTATDDFYNLCRAANYIQVDRIKNDMMWMAETEFGIMELTVNLSKPEKDPKDIEAARLQPTASYPKCQLCLENVGFAGNRAWQGRHNLRVIPIKLESDVGGQWYFQYSPYSYYNEHCIVLSHFHNPMEISADTFRRLFDFIKLFPHYFAGSNADLPIVGGSILSHEHFQGGRHTFPMDKAECYRFYSHEKYPEVTIGLVKWPMSVIRLSSSNEEELVGLASDILKVWREYSEGDIMDSSLNTLHNTITPIARLDDGIFKLDLVLRNNRTTEEHPDGLFHPHQEWHHVKKENIGLIEVMGLAILPGRLKADIEQGKIRKDEITRVFVNVLNDCGVFKYTDQGRERFDRFMKSVGVV